MKSKQSKPREVREELREKGRVIINIYQSILPFLPSLPLISSSRVGRNFLYGIYHHKSILLLPICFFKGRVGRAAFTSFIDSGFPLPLSLNFKGRVREEPREEWRREL